MALKDVRDTAIGGGLRYPYSALTDNTDYLLINVVDYKSAGSKTGTTEVFIGDESSSKPDTISTFSAIRKNRLYNTNVVNKNKKQNLGSIILPIPSNIQDGNSVNFGPGSLDGLTASVLDYAYSTMRGAGTIKSLSDFGPQITNILKMGLSTIATGDALEYFTRNLAASAANIPFGGNLTASQLLARQTGQILNPNMELLFEGVNLRSFKFSFKMTPRDYKEAESVKRIIRTFKKNMTPQAEGSLYLNTPNIFELSYMKGENPHPFLHKFKQCALTDMSVNYTGEGTYATYGGPDDQGGGTPVSMVMDLGFKELEPIYSGDYDNEAGQGGVGF